MKYKHILDIEDLNIDECNEIISLANETRNQQCDQLAGKSVALIFEKPSLRTRHSTERAITQLGGSSIYVQKEEIDLGQRESEEDVIRVLGRYHSFVFARVFKHETLVKMAECDVVPVVNMLSDYSHPLQAFADVMTIKEEFGDVQGKKIAYVGDANNVARSLGQIAKMFDMEFSIASPDGYTFSETDRKAIESIGPIELETSDPVKAVKNADVVYTDVWVSMGDEQESEKRLKDFQGYGVTRDLMNNANEDAIFLHCLPAHRGLEVEADVIDSKLARVWDQAENRLHSVRGLLAYLSRRI